MIHEKAITTKRTTRTGKAAGKKGKAKISIAINDADRAVSRLWEQVKHFYSLRNQTAAETARSVFLNGLSVMLQEIHQESIEKEEKRNNDGQGKLI